MLLLLSVSTLREPAEVARWAIHSSFMTWCAFWYPGSRARVPSQLAHLFMISILSAGRGSPRGSVAAVKGVFLPESSPLMLWVIRAFLASSSSNFPSCRLRPFDMSDMVLSQILVILPPPGSSIYDFAMQRTQRFQLV